MPINTSAFHPIIEAWLQAQEMARRNKQEQLDREEKQKLQDQAFKHQENLRKSELDARKADLEQQNRRQAYNNIISQIGKGNMKLQGMYQMPQTPSAINYDSPSAHLEPNPQGGFNVVSAPFQSTQEIPKTTFEPEVTSHYDVPGVSGGPIDVNASDVSTPEEMYQRIFKTTEAKQQALRPNIQEQIKGRIRAAEVGQEGRANIAGALEQGRNEREAKREANALEIARIRTAAATSNALDKPIGLTGAQYGLDPKMKLRDVPSNVAKPLSPAEDQKKKDLEELMGYSQGALNAGNTTQWKQFHGFGGNLRQYLASKLSPGDKDEQYMRFAVGRLMGIEGHRLFGSAFTQNEQAILLRSMADFSQHPETAKTNLEQLNKVFRDAYVRTIGPRTFPGVSGTQNPSPATPVTNIRNADGTPYIPPER